METQPQFIIIINIIILKYGEMKSSKQFPRTSELQFKDDGEDTAVSSHSFPSR